MIKKSINQTNFQVFDERCLPIFKNLIYQAQININQKLKLTDIDQKFIDINKNQSMKSQAKIKQEETFNGAVAYKKVDITFQNIQYSVKVEVEQEGCTLPCQKQYKEKQILKGITGIAKAGEVTAIMGASGAGKTTLLNAIACRFDHVPKNPEPGQASGIFQANGQGYSFSSFGDFGNYVMQNDILLATLTVRETLEYVATLKLNISSEQRKQLVSKLIHSLKLQNCADTFVGNYMIKGISGGQKKRTSIAFELISDPTVIMLDQPTSGLDSLTAYIICKNLQTLAHENNKTVLMTIHQPNSEIFNLFDKLILIVEGRCIYQGRANESIDYFQKIGFLCPKFSNPPDYFMSIMHHQSQQNISNYPKYFENYDKILAPAIEIQIKQKNKEVIQERKQEVSFCQKLGAILKRDAINVIRNPLVIKARIIQTIFLGLFVGGTYFNIDQKDEYVVQSGVNGVEIAGTDFYTLTGLLFFLCISGMMTALVPVAIVFPIQRPVFLKEEGSRLYGTFVFFMSRNIIQIPFLILIPLLWSCILYWMIGLSNTVEQFFTFYLLLFLIGFCGNSLGLLLGSLIKDSKLVSVIMPIFILPLIVFSGFFKNRSDIGAWISWLQYISPMKYSFIGFVKNQFEGVKDNQKPLSFLQFNETISLWQSVYILLGLGIFFRFFSVVFLYLGRTKLQ